HVLPAIRPTHEEFARGVALLVIVVAAAVGSAEAIEPVSFPGRGHGRREQLAQTALDALVLVLDVEEELEAVAGAYVLAKVGLVGVDLEDLQDDVMGHTLPLGRMQEARIEAGCLRLLAVVDLGVDDALVDGGRAGDELACRIARHGDLVVVALAEDADTY